MSWSFLLETATKLFGKVDFSKHRKIKFSQRCNIQIRVVQYITRIYQWWQCRDNLNYLSSGNSPTIKSHFLTCPAVIVVYKTIIFHNCQLGRNDIRQMIFGSCLITLDKPALSHYRTICSGFHKKDNWNTPLRSKIVFLKLVLRFPPGQSHTLVCIVVLFG